MRYARLIVLGGLAFLLGVAGLHGSELAKAAKKEKERRAKIQKKQVFVMTNEDLQKVRGVVNQPDAGDVYRTPGQDAGKQTNTSMPGRMIAPDAMDKMSPEDKKANRQPGEYLDSNGNGEQYWRTKLDSAKSRVSELESKQARLQSEVPRLATAFVNTDDPGQQSLRKTEWDEAKAELAQVQKDVGGAKADLNRLMSEGRRAGALPGWLR